MTMAPKQVPPGGPPNSIKANVPPSQTLYCSNLPDKIQKQDLRRSLYILFSTYGPILDVVALRTMKMRGQAHIVFRDIQASTQAMRALQGFEFFGKQMKISYAKGKSLTVAKLDGTYKYTPAAQPSTSTQLQQSIFNAPPSEAAKKPTDQADGAGVKRPRDEDEDEGDASMEEDDEDDAMDVSDED